MSLLRRLFSLPTSFKVEILLFAATARVRRRQKITLVIVIRLTCVNIAPRGTQLAVIMAKTEARFIPCAGVLNHIITV